MLSRRDLLKRSARLSTIAAFGGTLGCSSDAPPDAPGKSNEPAADATTPTPGVLLNDRQSQLNPTRVRNVVRVLNSEDVQRQVRTASRDSVAISVSGGRHAMGGQQFGKDTLHLDTTAFNSVLAFDREQGLIRVQAGIQWPELIEYLHREQTDQATTWTIRQKQTGVDRVSLAGTLSANAHGRGLQFPPIAGDVESILVVDASGESHACSRTENTELFSLAVGGYGLFGVIAEVTLRLVPRVKVERTVEVIEVRDLLNRVEQRIGDGYKFGDCQYSTDFSDLDQPHQGVFSCYRPVSAETPVPESTRQLSAEDWTQLIYLGHTDRQRAFETYATHYLATDGQVYWSDTHQMSNNFDDYHKVLDRQLKNNHPGSEMITEVYVRRDQLDSFLKAARRSVNEHGIDLIYGTIRFIERDDVSFLAWAKEQSVCVLCNLHVDHSPQGIEKAASDARRLIQIAIDHGGRYFPTYHRWATRDQVLAAYPQFVEFLQLKRKHDPEEQFQSEWYRHYRTMFADTLKS
jgi:FAD/FMN-containing dehydrogenase